MASNWGLYLIPFVRWVTIASKVNKSNNFPDGNIYHIYNKWNDEQWSKNKNWGSCSICKKYVNTYFQLEKEEESIFNFIPQNEFE